MVQKANSSALEKPVALVGAPGETRGEVLKFRNMVPGYRQHDARRVTWLGNAVRPDRR